MREDISPANFVKEAIRIISEEGLLALTIRRLGRDMHCNSANIYYYFNDLEELIAYASMEYCSQYVAEVSRCCESAPDAITGYRQAWDRMVELSFETPLIYEKLLYGKYRDRLGDIARGYYRLFPEKAENLDPDIMETITSPGFSSYHDNLILSRCIEAGCFAKEDSKVIPFSVEVLGIFQSFCFAPFSIVYLNPLETPIFTRKSFALSGHFFIEKFFKVCYNNSTL